MKTSLTLIAIVSLCVSPVFATDYYTAGHADIGLGEHDEIELHLHAHEGAIINGSPLLEDDEFEPDDVVIVVPNITLFARPVGTQWDFLGNNAGDNTWLLPASGSAALDQNAPFLGIGAEEVELDVFVGDQLTLTLIDVDGPGHVSFYTVSAGTPNVSMASSDGIDQNDAITVLAGAGGHGHYNIAFSEAGWYAVTLESSAVVADTQERLTSTETFTFWVVPEPATLGLLLLGAVGLKRRQ